jgi:hypothetical protein
MSAALTVADLPLWNATSSITLIATMARSLRISIVRHAPRSPGGN